LLAKNGFESLGINNIAREAGVDKVLIYRYFGGLPQLFRAFAEKGNFSPSLEEIVPAVKNQDRKSAEDTFRDAPQEIPAWSQRARYGAVTFEGELAGNNDLVCQTAELRADQGKG